jgi:hypothetical protein
MMWQSWKLCDKTFIKNDLTHESMYMMHLTKISCGNMLMMAEKIITKSHKNKLYGMCIPFLWRSRILLWQWRSCKVIIQFWVHTVSINPSSSPINYCISTTVCARTEKRYSAHNLLTTFLSCAYRALVYIYAYVKSGLSMLI